MRNRSDERYLPEGSSAGIDQLRCTRKGRREIENVTGRDVSIGVVYATLDRLEAKERVDSTREVDERSRRVFNVTPAGAGAPASSRAMRERLWKGIDLRKLLADGAGY